MALLTSKTRKAEQAIMEGIIEIKAFQNMTCIGKDPIETEKGCKAAIMMILTVIVGDSMEKLACVGYCVDHLFMLQPYVKLGSHIDMGA